MDFSNASKHYAHHKRKMYSLINGRKLDGDAVMLRFSLIIKADCRNHYPMPIRGITLFDVGRKDAVAVIKPEARLKISRGFSGGSIQG